MAKTKPQAAAVTNGVVKKVKDGRVTKQDSNDKKKLQDKIAAASSEDDASSESDDQSASDESGSDSDSDSGSNSSSGSESESETEKDAASKPVARKINGNAKLANGDGETDGSESDDEDASDADEVPPKSKKAEAGAAKIVGKKSARDSESSDESDSDSDSASDNVGKDKKATKKSSVDDSSSSSGSESDGSSSSSSDSGSEDKPSKKKAAAAPVDALPKKRKAEPAQAFDSKKPKANSNATKNLFVGNISWNVDEEWLAREFSEFGEVISCRIVTDRESGRSKGFGYIDFADNESAEKALFGKRGTELDGRPLNVDFSTPKKDFTDSRDRAQNRASKYGDTKSAASDTLWIGNLPFDCDSDTLRQECEQHGTILSVRIPTDRETGAAKGFGYVSFASVDEAKAAQESLAGTDIGGRLVRVDFAPPRPANGGFGGSPGGRGGMPSGNWRGGRGGGGGDRGGRGGFAPRGGRGGANTRGGMGRNSGGPGDFSGKKTTF